MVKYTRRARYPNTLVKTKQKLIFRRIMPLYTNFFRSQKVEMLSLLPQSPNLNLIENLWAAVEVALRKRDPQLSNIYELEKAVEEEWNAIPQKVYRNLILSMSTEFKL